MAEVDKNKPELKEVVKVPPDKIFHIKLEGYESTSDIEFFERLQNSLRQQGFNPEDLFYSGFDGTDIDEGIPRYLDIFGVNKPGWIETIKSGEENPAQYAQGFDVWCIGVYDKSQLAEAYSYKVDQEPGYFDETYQDTEPYLKRMKLKNIEVGTPLDELDPSQPVSEAVVHKNYPKNSPTDCLIGVVIISQD